ncbi:MAG: hypothetical protein ACI9EF_000436 [Pseudohongiellaceae bacterium]|jgi:hypothetical protein
MSANVGSQASLSLGRKIFYMLLPLALLCVVAEVSVRLLLPMSAADGLHSSRGFDPSARYLTPDPEHPGGWVTRIYGDSAQETTIAPRSDRRRVLLFGGSNTRGFPQVNLEKTLNQATQEEGTAWEVVNLGREGYGSRRALYLFEQAMVLQPDLVVIYSGHNEFVELGFELELQNDGASEVQDRFTDALSGLQFFQLMCFTLEEEPAPMPATNLDRADPSQRRLPWDQTLAVYDGYRKNLGLMCDIAAENGVPVVMSTVISNLFWLPRVWTPIDPLPERERQLHESRSITAAHLIPERFRHGFAPPIRLRGSAWQSGGSERDAESIPRLRRLSGGLSRDPRSKPGAEQTSGANTLWTDPELWGPDVPEVLDWFAEVMFADPTSAELEELSGAAAALKKEDETVPGDPRVIFMVGLVDWLQGNSEGAVARWREAAMLDRSPNTANDRTNGVVRDIAGSRPGVTLLDADQLFRSRCPDGLVSYEVMLDGCHMHLGARLVLMADMKDLIVDLELN